MRAVRLGPRDVVIDRRPDGTMHLRSPHPLPSYPAKLTERLEYWATPRRSASSWRSATAPAWRKITYGETLEQILRIAAALLERDLSPERPIVILSGNDIEHALLGLAAGYVGIPYAPMSPAYSLISRDFGKLRSIFDLLTPGLVFVADGEPFRRAIEAVVPADGNRRCAQPDPGPTDRPRSRTLLAPPATASPTATAAHARVGPIRSSNSYSPRARPGRPRR